MNALGKTTVVRTGLFAKAAAGLVCATMFAATPVLADSLSLNAGSSNETGIAAGAAPAAGAAIEAQTGTQVQTRMDAATPSAPPKAPAVSGNALTQAPSSGAQATGQIQTDGQTSAQTSTKTSGQTSAVTANPEELVGLPVLTLDGTSVGEVTAVQTQSNGQLSAVETKIGGILGFGAKKVVLPASEINIDADAVIVAMTDTQLKTMTE
ncbi:PRC-barrel domain-containing protein [Roseibium litorale]|uniref:PRC-barrel domain-containing protein n=1 Tax=Roseibium litorale TaxID=2803841 RepID=A0ABR9CRE6_9HYPH|nr:PRC-barrel domain-containing protein [Roseibium litorale]MBD8893248.1 PRC-barrel domain-containing protein [Roseibium litorale]